MITNLQQQTYVIHTLSVNLILYPCMYIIISFLAVLHVSDKFCSWPHTFQYANQYLCMLHFQLYYISLVFTSH